MSSQDMFALTLLVLNKVSLVLEKDQLKLEAVNF